MGEERGEGGELRKVRGRGGQRTGVKIGDSPYLLQKSSPTYRSLPVLQLQIQSILCSSSCDFFCGGGGGNDKWVTLR